MTGAPEPGESDLDAAIREVREETGYAVAGAIRPVGYRFAEAGDGEPMLQPLEHTEFRWCPLAEALELLHYPENRSALERAAALIR